MLLVEHWALFSCKEPINLWLFATYGCLIFTHLIGLIGRVSSTEFVKVCAVCIYFFVCVPFSFVWTLLGTIWYAKSEPNCVPEYLRGVPLVVTLMLSYIYVSVGLSMLLICIMMCMENRRGFSELSFIIVPNDDLRVDSLSRSLLANLEMQCFTVNTSDLYCPICFESMPVNFIKLGSPALKLPDCGHQMHSQCVREWFELKSTCPVCRRIITANIG